jgi:hypothetical protein
MADERLKAWLRQARADLEAGRANAGLECHRRYWLQQACEKGIKALGIVLWCGPTDDEGRFRRHFLYQHSPLKQLASDVGGDASMPKSLRLLLRQIEVELGRIDGEGLLRRVDATTARTDPSHVSYRYPFVESGKNVAPLDWNRADWDAYQGNFVGVSAAIERFLRVVENRRLRGRPPA